MGYTAVIKHFIEIDEKTLQKLTLNCDKVVYTDNLNFYPFRKKDH